MNAIELWLSSARNYRAGVRLYQQFGHDADLKASFAEAETPYKKKRLEDALRKLLDDHLQQETKAVTVVQQDVERAKPTMLKHGWPQQLDDVTGPLYQQWRPLFMENNHITNALWDVAKAGEHDSSKRMQAEQMVWRSLELEKEIDGIYSLRDYYLQHGKLPTQRDEYADELVTDANKIPRAYENCMRYIRHYKMKLEKVPGKAEKWMAQIKKYEWLAAQYREKMNL